MKAAILQCDHVRDGLRPAFADYDEMIRDMFAAIGSGIEFSTFDCQLGEYPEHTAEFDFFITTGSRAGVYEDLPWIPPLIEFIRKLDRQRCKLIGICFGHQAIAMALGGDVQQSDKGWGIGMASNRILQHKPWMHDQADHLDILVSHQDQVTELPADAEVIAASDFCPCFAVQWNDHMLSIQGHPEWHNDYSRALIELRRDIYPAELADRAIKSLGNAPDNALFTRWMLNFVSQ